MNFYFLCATQSSNLGDLLINKMLIDELCKYGNVYIDCYNIPSAFKDYILENKKTIDIYKIFKFSLKKGNIIRFSIFLKKQNIKYFTQSPGPLGKLSKNYAIYFKLISYILKIKRIKYFLIGNCYYKSIANNEKISINYADAYYVRSMSSLRFLSNKHIKNVHYIPDLAFLYRSQAIITNDEKIATFCFRNVHLKYDCFIRWLKDTITILQTKGFCVEFIYQVHKDSDFYYKMINDLREYKNIIFHEEILWYNNINYYSGKSLIISNRLHSLLLGTIHNAIPIAFCDDSMEALKIKDIYYSIFHDFSTKLFISINSTVGNMDAILDNVNSIKEHISQIADYNYSLCCNIIREMFNSAFD